MIPWLDVRTTIQYGIVNLSDNVSSVGIPLNIPLMRLRGPHTYGAAMEELSAAVDAADKLLQDRASSGIDVFVICRRGIDSVAATKYLLDYYPQAKHERAAVSASDGSEDGDAAVAASIPALGKVTFRNIEGGLNAWRSDVDQTFPEY